MNKNGNGIRCFLGHFAMSEGRKGAIFQGYSLPKARAISATYLR